MRHSLLKFSICILWCLSSVVASGNIEEKRFANLSFELDNNFENGELQPWVEESRASARWKIENKSTPWEPNNPSPQPPNGQSHLRVHRGASLSTFGVAVLRSPTFTLLPNENYIFSFSFWIRSKWPQFTNLELYLAENGNEKLLLSLYNYSDVTNLAWQTHSVSLTGDLPSTLSLSFYAYCGTDIEDAVAIDDIQLTSSLQTTSPDSTDLTTTTITSEYTPTTGKTLSTSSPEMEPTSTSSTSTTASTTTLTTTSTAKPTTKSTTMELTTSTSSETDSSVVTSTTPESTTIQSMMCNTMTTQSTFFSCPNNLELNYPDPNNPCSKIFYHCLDCVATEYQCLKNQVFSNQTQSCRPCVQVPLCVDECRD